MSKPVITSVSPVFKIQNDANKASILADKYLYAVNLGAMTKMVKGGDYYLGKDGNPYYPKNKTKPKPIPVAKYFFCISDTTLSSKQIEKLTRKTCFEAVTLTRDPKQEVLLKDAVPDYVYIVGRGSFYTAAYKYFLWGQRFPADWITKPEGKVKELLLEDIFSEISNLNKPYRDINIVSHANEHSWLGFSLKLNKEVKVKGQLVDKEIKKRVTYYSLKEKLKQGGLDDLSAILDAGNNVFIRGCNIGQNTAMLNLLKKAFGDKSGVYAPTHKQHYSWYQKKSKKTTLEYFHTYWLRYKGVIKKKPNQLKTEFSTKYPQVKSKLWKGYVRKAKRKMISLPTNYMLRYRHPDDLNSKKCLKFARKYWKAIFRKNKQRPSQFLRREGPKDATDNDGNPYKAYQYYFKGKFFDDEEKKWAQGTFSVLFEVLPEDADIFKKEKARHPHPEWYDWKMIKKNKGKMLKIQPKAQMTIYQIRKPIINAKGKYLHAEPTDTNYWGKSN
jgi:hypothetical protein